ncbi:MAG TPA: AbrB/MazE/SpoVT family DNA-binding domain-containing protein [Tepidiformaceae bacterium]|jgi:AbrB family looped-hinge helix DNA binding protein|nr:AbrB/MazE/SpoVT family DNA-binding domain-containing protein [Tepidiformaceae bacterium]
METTKLSSKGQVILPKSVRVARNWQAGVEFAVEEVADGVLLRPLKPFPATHLEDVAGCVGYKGPRKSLEDMEQAILSEARKRK